MLATTYQRAGCHNLEDRGMNLPLSAKFKILTITNTSFQCIVYLCRRRKFLRWVVSHITSTFSAEGVRLTICVRVVMFDRDMEFFRQPWAAGAIVCQLLSYARFCVLRVRYVARRTHSISAACKTFLHAWQYENVKWVHSMVVRVVTCVVLLDTDVTEESAASIFMVEMEVFKNVSQ
jgi:hypothetical protein